jgi:hypothetical protein
MSFLTNFQIEYRMEKEVWDKADLISPLLGDNFIFVVNIDIFSKAKWGNEWENTALYKPSFVSLDKSLISLLPKIQKLSLPARTALYRAIRHSKRSGLVIYENIGPLHNTELEAEMSELADIGLIDLEPDPGMIKFELLMQHSLKDLKQFAFKRGVNSQGPKYRLIQAILDQVNQSEVFLLTASALDDKKYIKLLIYDDELQLFKQYTFNNTSLLRLYIEWVELALCFKLSPLQSRPVQVTPADQDLKPYYREIHPLAYLSEGWNQTEIRLVSEIWDSKCDEIILNLVDKYAWDFGWHIGDAIVAYLPTERLEVFKQACEKHQTHACYNVFMYYGQARAAELGIKIREPRLLTCPGCEKQFREWSVHPSLAKKVGYKILFCNSCYGNAFNSCYANPISASHIDASSLSKEDMLKRLSNLALALGTVPTTNFGQRLNFDSMSAEKQVTVITALLKLPSHEAYKNAFGSWLQALISANILEDGKKYAIFGIRCVANDGHECLSLSERVIDDWLSEHNIPHEKEPFYPYHTFLNPSGRMRADWKVGEHLIEYAGLMDEPEYAAKIETKQEIALEFGLSLIVVEPADILDIQEKLGHLANLGI